MFDLNDAVCPELKKYPVPGGHILTCPICSVQFLSTYKSWVSISRRVINSKPGRRDYKSYIEKGITFPKVWIDSFYNFLKDMGPKPSDKHSLRRIDRWSSYSKENCKWYLLEGGVDLDLSVKWKTPEYRAHDALRQRCLNPNHDSYKDYGGRKENPIKVCNRWLGPDGFRNFLADMGPRPSSAHSLERVNNNSHYEPINCEWRTLREQSRNKRSNQWVDFNGKRITIMDLHLETKISRPALYRRYHQGLREDDLVAKTRRYTRSV